MERFLVRIRSAGPDPGWWDRGSQTGRWEIKPVHEMKNKVERPVIGGHPASGHGG
jgi:hypothetical protein